MCFRLCPGLLPRNHAKSLSDAGYELRRVHVMYDYQEIRDRHDLILAAEAAQVHADWYQKYESLYSPKFSELIKRGQPIPIPRLQTALKARNKFRDQMTETMNENDIDLWICPPTAGPAPKGLHSHGRSGDGSSLDPDWLSCPQFSHSKKR